MTRKSPARSWIWRVQKRIASVQPWMRTIVGASSGPNTSVCRRGPPAPGGVAGGARRGRVGRGPFGGGADRGGGGGGPVGGGGVGGAPGGGRVETLRWGVGLVGGGGGAPRPPRGGGRRAAAGPRPAEEDVAAAHRAGLTAIVMRLR